MSEELLKPLESKRFDWRWGVVFSLLVLLGIGSGWGLVRWQKNFKTGSETEESGVNLEAGSEIKIKVGQTYGRADEVFKDTAVGVLEKNGVEGEGTHRLLREGGESQTAYLTSSVLDLDLFVGHKVQVWGETFAAQKAGWLMDVGKIKVLE